MAVCTVSSYNYLHYTLNLVRSIRRHWSANPVIYVMLLDGADLPRPGFEALGDVVFVSIDDLAIDNLTWLRVKHDAGQLCTVVRPIALDFILQRGHGEVFYCDSDIHFFGDPVAFMAENRAADFIVTPHMMSPMPRDDVWVPVAIGQVTIAGIINNGMFLCRNTPAALEFLRQYRDFMTGPAAALDDLGAVRDQQFFNWIVAFGSNVHISHDPTMNVAYWNLHERPIRWSQLDDGPADKWTIDGKPLLSFHFSGFDWDNNRLSSHDYRPTVLWNASLHALGEFYRAALRDSFESHYSAHPYAYAALGGTYLKPGIRVELKRSARIREPRLAQWEGAGTDVFRHMNSIFGSTYLVPAYFDNILQSRDDLRAAAGNQRIHPAYLCWWASEAFEREYEVGTLWERHGAFAIHKAYIEALARAIQPTMGSATVPEIVERLKTDRHKLIAELSAQGIAPDLLRRLGSADFRYAAIVPAQCLRLIYEGWQTLRTHFPDPLDKDFPAFHAWLKSDFPRDFDVPPAVTAFIETLDVDRSLARVIGFARRHAHTAAILRSHGIGQEVLADMIGLVNYGLGYGPDDLMIVDWWLVGRPAADIAALNVYVPDDLDKPSGQQYLEWWCRRQNASTGVGAENRSLSAHDVGIYVSALADVPGEKCTGNKNSPMDAAQRRISTFRARACNAISIIDAQKPPTPHTTSPTLAPDDLGINLFGYFKSPIGLAAASLGLSKALKVADYRVREHLLLADAMDNDLTLADLSLDFAFNYPRTMVVSHPHINYRQSEILPAAFARGRENVGYLAWEQRDFPRQWRPIVDQYDTVCALSRFAAESIARGIGRPVHALPCVVEIHHPVSKAAARKNWNIPDDKFVVGFCFDAGSSTDRKNPMAFADAVIAAFTGRSNVLVLVKYASAARPEFADRFNAFKDRMERSGLDHRIVTAYIDRAQVESLIASMDVYVSLHRSEGFGYTLAEAMMLGVPAMATGYSGNLDFMNEANSYLVDYKETVVRHRDGPFDIGTVWADPSVDDAADKLRSIYANYAVAQEKARRARADVEATVSVAAVAKRLKEILG